MSFLYIYVYVYVYICEHNYSCLQKNVSTCKLCGRAGDIAKIKKYIYHGNSFLKKSRMFLTAGSLWKQRLFGEGEDSL